MCNVACASSCSLEGSIGVLRPCWGFGTLGRGSSVELPLNDVCRDVEGVGREDHGDSERVAVVEEGQEVGCAGLAHR